MTLEERVKQLEEKQQLVDRIVLRSEVLRRYKEWGRLYDDHEVEE